MCRTSFLRNLSYDVYYTLRPLRRQQPPGRRRLAQPIRAGVARPVARNPPVANIFGQNLSAAAVNAIAIHADQRDERRTAGGRGHARRRGVRHCRLARSTSRSASSGARPRRNTSRMSTCVRATWSVSIPACRPPAMSPSNEIFAEVRVRSWPICRSSRISAQWRLPQFGLRPRRRRPVSNLPLWPRLARRTIRSRSAASFSAPFVRRTSVTCTAACS